MEFEQLQLTTIETLALKASEYGLSSEDKPVDLVDEVPILSGESILASVLSSALREVRDRELVLEERQESPEVVSLRSNMQRLRLLKERMNKCSETMGGLRTLYTSVTARTSSLHDACDRALAHQTALAAGSEQIHSNLHFFTQADVIMKKLNNTAKLSVTGQTFTSILASIDECLFFLKQHPQYKESAAYIAKFEQCLSRAMTSIRMGVITDLEASINDVRDRQAKLQVDYAKLGRGGADDDTFALLYGVFASRANSVKTALSVAEQRFSQVDEFQEMLSECQQAYFLTRKQLLIPIIQATLEHLVTVHGESSCALTRSGCSFLLRVCDDEFRLYRQFFSTDGSEAQSPRNVRESASLASFAISSNVHPFEDFTEELCRLLYDVLRPLVVHNPHLETLAELCTILKVEMIEERCSLITSIVGDESTSFDPRAGFVHVMGELVGDVAERIVYRAATYGVSDIVGYKPASGDLAYPEKLEMMKTIENNKKSAQSVPDAETSVVSEEGASVAKSTPISAVDLHCLWYPTVRRTVMCLAKLFKCLDMAVFQSIARDLLSMCIESLDFASAQIAASTSKKGGRSKQLDAELFVVKHLLILREQTTPYRQAASHRADATLPTRDFSIDFTKMKNSLFVDRARWFELSSNNAFLELLFSVPIQMNEEPGDSRLVIDSRLRITCNQLVTTSANLVLGPMAKFVDEAEDELLRPDFNLKACPQFSPSVLSEVSRAAFKALSTTWPELRLLYSLYIGVKETESILLAPVRKRISETFARAVSFANRAYDEEGRGIAALPNIQQVYLLLDKD